jgi:hypothetical protein
MVADIRTADPNDQTLTLDPNLAGYLDRVVIDHTGTDAAWSLTVTDTDGVTLWSKDDCDANTASYILTFPTLEGSYIAGIPFAGGVTMAIADANLAGEDVNSIHIKLYLRETWRR